MSQSRSEQRISPQQRLEVEAVFDRLVEEPSERWPALLDELCADKPEVRREVESLLSPSDATEPAVAQADPIKRQLRDAVEQVRSAAHADSLVGQWIGPYRVIERLGDGGMGSVYKAEQRRPLSRMVALKVIKAGFDTDEVVARFNSERQALARMDHPNIAKVLDAGSTDQGRPFFVMEYVAGVPLTSFADENKLSLRQRLDLFIPVCEAIAHAHTKAIIHRDIKASNILAFAHDGKHQVKVIDFGIAKALTSDKLTEATFNTMHGTVIGTYENMSPEQASGSPDIDTRTDVYSLGVLLYELLTGAKPVDSATLSRAADEERRRIICEVDPPRPSTRLSALGERATEIAEARRSRLDVLERQLRSELEWIPLKAMRKERERRYVSPLQLAEDIGNYLAGRPLIAGPESRVYRVKKFVGRNKGAVAAVASIALVVLAGVISTGVALRQALRARNAEAEQRALARAEAQQHAAVNQFLTEDVLAGARPDRLPDAALRDSIVRAMIDPAAKVVGEKFKNAPLTEAAVRSSLATSYSEIGRSDLALDHAARSLALRGGLLGDDHPDTLGAMTLLGIILQRQGKLTDAEAMYRRSLDGHRRVVGPEDPRTLAAMSNLAGLLLAQGKLADAEALARQTLQISERALGDNHPHTLRATNDLAVILRDQQKLAEAEPLFRSAVTNSRRVLGEDHPGTLGALTNLGYLLQTQGKFADAEPVYRESLERSRRALGDDHPQTLVALNNLGVLLRSLGNLAAAEQVYRESLEARRRVLGGDHPETLLAVSNMAGLLRAQKKLDEAERLYREAYEGSRRVLGDSHFATVGEKYNLARAMKELGKPSEAEPLFVEVYQSIAMLQPDASRTAVWTAGYGLCLAALGRFEQAEPLLRDAHRRIRELGQQRSNLMREVATALADVCERTNRPDEAARFRAEASPTTQ